MAEEPSLPYYLPIVGGRIIGFIPFPRVLVLCEMQSVLSRIWTRIAVFISYGDNDYTMGHLMVVLQFWNFWECWEFPSLPLLPGPLWLRFVVPVLVPSIGQIKLFSLLFGIIIICYLNPYFCVKIIYIR